MIQIAIAVGSLRMPLKNALQTAGSLKCSSVEIEARHYLKPSDLSTSGVRQIRKLLNDLNLQVAAIRFETRRGLNHPDQIDRRVAAVKDAMRMAVDLGCSTLVGWIGPPDDPEGDGELLRDVLIDLGRFGDHYGCFFSALTRATSASQLAQTLSASGEHNLFLAVDPNALLAGGHDPIPDDEAADLVRIVYAVDGVPERSHAAGVRPVALGRGVVDLPQMLAKLGDRQFFGPYVVDPGWNDHPLQAATQAVDFLRQIAYV